MLLGVEIQLLLPVSLPPDAALDGGVCHCEIGLHHLDAVCAVARFEQFDIRHGNEVFALFDHGLGFADRAVYLAQGAVYLILEVDGIIYNAQVLICAPRAQGAVVDLARVLDRFAARGVAEVIGKLRALGAGDEVDDRVIACEHLTLRFPADAHERFGKLLVGDIRLIVQKRAVVHDEHLLLRHDLRRRERELFLMYLVGDDEVLELEHGHAHAEGIYAEARDQLCRSFGDGYDAPAVILLELLEDAAYERRFAGGGAAGQHDAVYLFAHFHFSSPKRKPESSATVLKYLSQFARMKLSISGISFDQPAAAKSTPQLLAMS